MQLSDPLSCVVSEPAIAMAAGFDCVWHAAAGVVAVLVTVTVTDPPGAMAPSEQLSAFPTMGLTHVPAVVVAVDHTSPPAPGSASLSVTGAVD